MHNKYNKKLRLIWMFIIAVILIHLGWLFVELNSTKQSLANGYQEVGNKLELFQAQINQIR